MSRIPSTVKTMALAVALALPAASAFSASMSDIVTTREDQDVHQQYGRDSVYAMQTRQPQQTASHLSSDSGVGKFFAGVGAAGASAWHKMTSAFEPGSHTVAAQQPSLYGRAGGYVGTDQLALLERAGPATDVSQPVTAGETLAIAPAERDIRYPAASESQLYERSENRFSHATQAAPTASGEPMHSAGEPMTSEQPVVANDVPAPAANESQPYGRETQPYGRNEDQFSEPAATPPAAVASEPTEQPSAANEPTMFGRDESNVYESAAAGGAGQPADADQSAGVSKEGPAGEIPDAAQATDSQAADNTSVTTDAAAGTDAQSSAAQSASAAQSEGAGESAQSAPSPDSVTVLDEEQSRLGQQSDEASVPERSSGRL